MAVEIGVDVLVNGGDVRGHSYQLSPALSFLGTVADVHAMTIEPGCGRGHHFHRRKHEILVVQHEDAWNLLWDNGPGGEAQARMFEGSGAVVIAVPPGCSHAIENSGRKPLHVLGLSDRSYNPIAPDAYPRPIEIVPARSATK